MTNLYFKDILTKQKDETVFTRLAVEHDFAAI